MGTFRIVAFSIEPMKEELGLKKGTNYYFKVDSVKKGELTIKIMEE